MSKMVGDNRACANAVNSMMEYMATRRTIPMADREVDYHRGLYLFGHYDSRGGASIVQARNIKVAMEKYIKSCGWDERDSQGEIVDSSWNSALEDLMEPRTINLIVCDEPIPDDPPDLELLEDYADIGYKCGVVEYKGQSPRGKWRETETRILWKNKLTDEENEDDEKYMEDAPKLPIMDVMGDKREFRVVKWEPGEDAYGLILVRRGDY